MLHGDVLTAVHLALGDPDVEDTQSNKEDVYAAARDEAAIDDHLPRIWLGKCLSTCTPGCGMNFFLTNTPHLTSNTIFECSP